MIHRLGAILLAAVVLVVGLAWADEDGPENKPKPDGAPRLKRKKRAAPPEAKPPAKAEKDTPKDKQPDKDKAKEAEDDAIVPEDGVGDAEEDDQEIMERLAKNMRAVEEKLSNREVGEPTRQQQRDILKDIDSLLRRKQQQSGGGGGQPPPQGGADQQDQEQDKQGGAEQKQGGSSQRRMAKGKQRGKRNARAQRQRRPGRGKRMTAGRQQPDQGNEPQPMPQTGNEPGRGGNDPPGKKRDPKDPYKDVWGHLPESLRAQMDAYSNPQPFMPRYDDLVKKYYRTIAEQGRKKGD
jgi:hypothetical protein